jgi:hypothetical protein
MMPVGRKEVAAMTRTEQRSTTSPSSPNHRRPLDLRRPSSREQGKGALGALSRSRWRCLQFWGGLCSLAFAHCSCPEENGRERRRVELEEAPTSSSPGAARSGRASTATSHAAASSALGVMQSGEERRHGSPAGVGRGQGTGRAGGRWGREEARLAGRAGSTIRRRWGRRRRVGRWR